MRKLVTLVFLATVVTLALSAVSLAGSRSTVWTAKLTVAQEVPKQVVKDTAASGSFTGTLTGTKLKFTLSFSKLTGAATAAHIHVGAMGVAGNVLVPLCIGATASSSSTTAANSCKSPVTATIQLASALISALTKDSAKHLLYVNVHTAKNPNGEIRGQLG